MRASLPLLTLLAAGCIRDSRGPFLGECAVYDDDVYTFGEIGIGTCLAGPADLQFFEQGGGTWLAVSNADPFLNFRSGSVLLLDWDALDPSQRVHDIADLAAYAVPTKRFVGGMAYLAGREELLVTNRLSEGAVTRSEDDQGFLIDVSDPTSPRLAPGQPEIPMEDDPFPVVVDEDAGLAYVGNLTAHSITPFDITEALITPVDIAPQTVVGTPLFVDVDASGTLAAVDSLTISDAELAAPDLWTLTFVDKLVRLWVPTLNEEGEIGLTRWTSGDEDFVASGLGIEIDPADDPTIGQLEDPFVFTDASGVLRMLYEDGGVIRSLVSSGAAGDWLAGDIFDLSGGGGWDELVAGPSATGLSATVGAIFYDGRVAEGEEASIGLATTEDGLTYAPMQDPVLTEPGVSLEDPFVRADEISNSFRMWMSRFDGDSWSIGLAESEDGVAWGPIEVVTGLGDGDVAAPAVSYVNGRYLMWFTTGDGATWSHATAWSYDGRTWFEPTFVVPSELDPTAPTQPPRVAVQVDTTNAWRLEGRDEGVVDGLVPAGVRVIVPNQGLSLTLASGQEVDNALLPDNRSADGLLAGSALTFDVEGDGDEEPVLYVTAIGLDERRRIGAIRPVGNSWAYLESDIVPSGEGGNVAGASDPLVVRAADGTFVMFYSVEDQEGLTTLRRATSDDGRSFEPTSGPVLTSPDEFDDAGQAAHSIEVLEDGTYRLWYGAFDGSRWVIAAATANDLLGTFTADPGPFDPWQLGTGAPGSFDDSGVKDPMVFTEGGRTQMYYAGFDGTSWHVGHAVLDDDVWVRRTDPVTEQSIPAMSGLPGSFSSLGVEDPVLVELDGESVLWHSGTDGVRFHLGRAIPQGEVVYAAQRFPTPGDTITFEVTPGGPMQTDIELEQIVDEFASSGIGMSALTLDEERGFLYVTSKLANFVYVVDVRDDTSGILDDANYLDIEELISIESDFTPLGFRDAVVDPVRDRLYLTAHDPDGVVVVDLNDVVDDDTKDVVYQAAMGVLPLLDADEDAGPPTAARIGGNGMAITADGDLLLVTHLRGNALWIFDLSMGPFGEPIAVLQNLGENPHVVRISPDGRHAVVANYLGEVDEDGTTSGTLAVVDIDPASETFLETVTWIVNR